MNCPHCGDEITPEDTFCPVCGVTLRKGFPRQLVLLPLAFVLLILLMLFLAWVLK